MREKQEQDVWSGQRQGSRNVVASSDRELMREIRLSGSISGRRW